MIIYANRTAPAALDKAVIHEEGLWTKVFHDPEKYRGELLHFEGRLKKLRQFPAQAMAIQGGAKDYYEGYLSVDAWNDDPVFFICTELPAGLTPGESLDVPVGVSGYFYKIFRYTPADAKQTHKDRLAPLLIGPRLTLTQRRRRTRRRRRGLGMARVARSGVFRRHRPDARRCCSRSATGSGTATAHVHGRVHAARFGEFVPPPRPPPDPQMRPNVAPTSIRASGPSDESRTLAH